MRHPHSMGCRRWPGKRWGGRRYGLSCFTRQDAGPEETSRPTAVIPTTPQPQRPAPFVLTSRPVPASIRTRPGQRRPRARAPAARRGAGAPRHDRAPPRGRRRAAVSSGPLGFEVQGHLVVGALVGKQRVVGLLARFLDRSRAIGPLGRLRRSVQIPTTCTSHRQGPHQGQRENRQRVTHGLTFHGAGRAGFRRVPLSASDLSVTAPSISSSRSVWRDTWTWAAPAWRSSGSSPRGSETARSPRAGARSNTERVVARQLLEQGGGDLLEVLRRGLGPLPDSPVAGDDHEHPELGFDQHLQPPTSLVAHVLGVALLQPSLVAGLHVADPGRGCEKDREHTQRQHQAP